MEWLGANGARPARRATALRTGAVLGMVTMLAAVAPGCGRSRPPATAAVPLPVAIRADTGASERWNVVPSRARAWLERTSRVPITPPAPAPGSENPTPEPAPIPPAGAESRASIDAALKPPILRTPARLVMPEGVSTPRRASVELDVRVDERGRVTEARPAGGDADPALIEAARQSALGMTFYPALRGDQPVAVWCRQRFDFGPR